MNVLDPSAIAGFAEGFWAHSTEDDQVYLVTAAGAVPGFAPRGAEVLDDAQLAPIGSDWLAGGTPIVVTQPAEPVDIDPMGLAGRVFGYFHGPSAQALVSTGSALMAASYVPVAEATGGGRLDFSDPANSGLIALFPLQIAAAPAALPPGTLDFSDQANSGLIVALFPLQIAAAA